MMSAGRSGAPAAARRQLLAALLKERGIRTSRQTAIAPRSEQGPAPLSFNQEGMWFIEQLEPGKSMYNIPGTALVRGNLDVAALRGALTEIVTRHESLRTTFRLVDGSACQVIQPARNIDLPVVDLSALPADQHDAEVVRIAHEATRAPFDLENGPLFRSMLVRKADDEHVFIFATHHLVCDGWSMGVFTRELRTLYSAFSRGDASPLPAPGLQFADFATWERRRMQGPSVEELLSYWRGQLEEPSALQLPTDHPRPPVPSYQGRHHPVELRTHVRDRLQLLARGSGVTLFHTLLAAFNALLHYKTGQPRIVVGSTFANRTRPELDSIIGCLVNILPLRTDVSDDPSFDRLQKRVRDVVVGATAHQELSLTQLVKELQPGRDLNNQPFFQVMFYYMTPDHSPSVYGYGVSAPLVETLEIDNLTLTPIDVEVELARFDIVVVIWDLPEGLSLTIEYSTDLFERSSIARFAELYTMTLDHVVARPEATLSEIVGMLDAAETKRRTQGGEATRASFKRKLQEIKARRAEGPRPPVTRVATEPAQGEKTS